MKPSELLLKAAEYMHDECTTGCCYAISHVADVHDDGFQYDYEFECSEYFLLLNPTEFDYTPSMFFFGDRRRDGTEENVHVRVVALCLAAAIAESEGN